MFFTCASMLMKEWDWQNPLSLVLAPDFFLVCVSVHFVCSVFLSFEDRVLNMITFGVVLGASRRFMFNPQWLTYDIFIDVATMATLMLALIISCDQIAHYIMYA